MKQKNQKQTPLPILEIYKNAKLDNQYVYEEYLVILIQDIWLFVGLVSVRPG